jgi:hypothetical protein
MFPELPGATLVTADVPAPTNTAPLVKVAAPVPPWATVRAVVKPVIDVAFSVPVTATPDDVTAILVEPPLCIFKSPLLSAVVTTPPEPVVIAFIDEAIIFPL